VAVVLEAENSALDLCWILNLIAIHSRNQPLWTVLWHWSCYLSRHCQNSFAILAAVAFWSCYSACITVFCRMCIFCLRWYVQATV